METQDWITVIAIDTLSYSLHNVDPLPLYLIQLISPHSITQSLIQLILILIRRVDYKNTLFILILF